MIDNLLNYCSKFTQLTALDKEAMGLNFKPIELKRRDFLLKAGMVCDFVAFLNAGVIRHYHLKNGTEITCDITLKNNFITDFKGYKLGMSVAEIDRLLAYRKTNKYVNSASEFQQVTKVSDSLLHTIAPYFKFPDWVTNKKEFHSYSKIPFDKVAKIIVLDINEAKSEDLIKVYGIGEGLSARILKEKEKFGGFVSMEQMKDIWGLSPEVIERLEKEFKVSPLVKVKKIAVNNASVKELAQFPYFRYALAKSIVTYRSMNGDIKNAKDLLKINGFPVEKVNIIALYLDF